MGEIKTLIFDVLGTVVDEPARSWPRRSPRWAMTGRPRQAADAGMEPAARGVDR